MTRTAISVTPGGGASVVGEQREGGFHQGVFQAPIGRIPLGATYHAVPSAAATLAPVPSADMALIVMDPGAAMRWSTAATANGSLGMLLAAGGSFPEALEIVGSAMLSRFNYAMNAGETSQGRFFLEYYRFVL